MNKHKSGAGRSTLGAKPAPLFEFSNLIISTLRDRFPGLIWEQILRIDFWRHVETGKYFLNEVEGFNAQKAATAARGNSSKGSILDADIIQYWFCIICSLVDYELMRRALNLRENLIK
jgi:hypothetical protein